VLPLAHLGHWLWIPYVLPVLIVIAAILRSSMLAKRRDSVPPGPPADAPWAGENLPAAGGAGRDPENGGEAPAHRVPSR
jgi:hypothetical protein